eukprot:244553-Prorocentrum_minimum.AAC.2
MNATLGIPQRSPPLLRLVRMLGICCLPSCNWFSHWVCTASPTAVPIVDRWLQLTATDAATAAEKAGIPVGHLYIGTLRQRLGHVVAIRPQVTSNSIRWVLIPSDETRGLVWPEAAARWRSA